MIEHELDVGREVGERDRLVDLVRPDAEIERPARSGEALDIRAKGRAFAEVVGNDVQDAAESLHERIGELALEKGGKAVILRPACADRAAQQALRLCAPASSTLRVSASMSAGRDVDLHVDGVGDAAAPRLGGIGLIREIAIERRRRPASQG